MGSGVLMPFVHYSATQKAEAIALCRVVGTEEASTRLGIGVATLRVWSKAAGVSPDVDEDLLDAQYQLALAKSADEIASGKVKGPT